MLLLQWRRVTSDLATSHSQVVNTFRSPSQPRLRLRLLVRDTRQYWLQIRPLIWPKGIAVGWAIGIDDAVLFPSVAGRIVMPGSLGVVLGVGLGLLGVVLAVVHGVVSPLKIKG